MAETGRILFLAAALLASTAAAPAGAAGPKLFVPASDPAASQPLPLLQPFPGEPAPVVAGRSRLVPFEQAASDMRLLGEGDTRVLTFSLTGAQRAAGGQLQIAYRNAVSVLPETASIEIAVNGKVLGAFAARSPNGFTMETLGVNADLLREGRNEVRLSVRQRHRVDCSLAATYELWDEIDPLSSGFMAADAGFRTLEDLLTVGRGEGGVTDIRLIAPRTGIEAVANDALPLVQALALYLNRPDMAVTVASTPGTGPGVDVYVGPPEAYDSPLPGRAPPGVSVRDAGSGRAALILAGSGAELQAQLVAAVGGPMRAGFDSGVRASAYGRIVVQPASRYTLKDAGYRTQPFSGRLSRFAFTMEMPADFYPAEYASVDLFLKGATAPGLKPGAQLLVRVNGESARSYPFRDPRGEEFEGKRLELPLRAFRPGVNHVEIIGELPVAADEVCALEGRDESRPRFILLEESEIRVPELARVGRLPDLGAFSGAAYPFAGGRPFDVFVGNGDHRTLGAAFTMLARLSQSARSPLPGEIVFSAPQEERGRDALVVSAGQAVAVLSAPKGGRLTAAGQPVTGALDPVTTASVQSPPVSPPSAGPLDSRSLLAAFHSSTATEGEDLSLTDRAAQWAHSAAARFSQWLQYERGEEPSAAMGGSLVTLSQERSPLGSATWTVVRAANPADLEKGVAHLTRASTWTALEGGKASIGAERLDLVTAPVSERYVHELPDKGFGNLRRIAAAWLSDNFQFYIVSLIALMTVLALWLGRAVPRMGVRTEE